MSVRPPGVPRINEVPKKMKTFPPRYRGFLEKRYGPEPVIVEVVCRPNPQKEAGGEERHADDESGCGMKAWKTKDLVYASAKERERESDDNDENIMEHAF